jgi:hypothetical protein
MNKIHLRRMNKMRKPFYIFANLRSEKGATLVFVALLFTIFLGITALAVDVGYLMVSRNELQNVADASALAGARTLGRLYECDGNLVACPRAMPYDNQLTYVADTAAIGSASKNVALQNQAGGKAGIIINDADIVIGNWDAPNKRISPITNTSPDAVQVTARRDGAANGPITTFFASVMGIDTMNVSATATAALTGESTAGPGGLPIPAAININWFNKPSSEWCNQNITFHPSSAEVCAAWHAYDGLTYKSNGSKKKGIVGEIEDITAGTYSSPETIAGQTKYDFTNGTLADVFTSDAIQNLFNTMKVKNDGILDNDTDPTTWTTGIAVYNSPECNPSGLIPIAGFATIIITSVSGPPESTIYATVKCDNVETGRGSGLTTGTKGSIPGLVQ